MYRGAAVVGNAERNGRGCHGAGCGLESSVVRVGVTMVNVTKGVEVIRRRRR